MPWIVTGEYLALSSKCEPFHRPGLSAGQAAKFLAHERCALLFSFGSCALRSAYFTGIDSFGRMRHAGGMHPSDRRSAAFVLTSSCSRALAASFPGYDGSTV